jgi:hypothetical protein
MQLKKIYRKKLSKFKLNANIEIEKYLENKNYYPKKNYIHLNNNNNKLYLNKLTSSFIIQLFFFLKKELIFLKILKKHQFIFLIENFCLILKENFKLVLNKYSNIPEEIKISYNKIKYYNNFLLNIYFKHKIIIIKNDSKNLSLYFLNQILNLIIYNLINNVLIKILKKENSIYTALKFKKIFINISKNYVSNNYK